jgi:geranylgeranyl diphosphate synthase type I
MYHTWTLVHDDLIDNDDVRRNGATVHAMFSVRARQRVETGGDWAQQYGRDLAVLVGDSQH